MENKETNVMRKFKTVEIRMEDFEKLHKTTVLFKRLSRENKSNFIPNTKVAILERLFSTYFNEMIEDIKRETE